MLETSGMRGIDNRRLAALEVLRAPVNGEAVNSRPHLVLTQAGDCAAGNQGNIYQDSSLDSTAGVTIQGDSVEAGNGTTEDVTVRITLASTGEEIGYAHYNGSGGYNSDGYGGGDSGDGGDGGGDGGGGDGGGDGGTYGC